MRDFRVRNKTESGDHRTGRKCDNTGCGGDLHDSIIHFGESLREETVYEGYRHGVRSDLMLSLGSSMRVSPANAIAGACTKTGKGKLVIVNL